MDTEALAHRRFDLRGHGTLHTGHLIHHYPGKRALYRGSLNGQPVVAKFYLRPLRTAWEWWRGARGARILQRAGIPSPAVRYAGLERSTRTWLTVVDWIEADSAWPPYRNPLPPHVHELLLRTLVTHHEAGVVQNDLNWANFIPRDDVLYSIDGDRVRQHSAPLSYRRTRHNLRRLYGSKTHFSAGDVRRGWQEYWRLRGQPASAAGTRTFVSAVQVHRRHVGEQVSRRKLGGWKHFVRERDSRTLLVAHGRQMDPEQRLRLRRFTAAPERHSGQNSSLGWQTEADTLCRGPGRVQHHAGSALERLRNGRSPQAVWYRAAVAARLRLPVEPPIGFFQAAAGPFARSGRVVFQARARQSLAEALDTGSIAGDTVMWQCRDLLESLATARMPHPCLELNGLGWDGEKVILLDVRGLRLETPWRGAPAFPHHLPLLHELGARLEQPVTEIRRQLIG